MVALVQPSTAAFDTGLSQPDAVRANLACGYSPGKPAHDLGYGIRNLGARSMSQFSVYMRFCTSQAQVDTLCKKVENALPLGGKVNVLQFTDKQYERIISYHGQAKQPAYKAPDQFDLF